LSFLPPQPYVFVRQDQGNDDTLDSDADPSTGETAPFVVAAASVDTTRDAGLSTCGNAVRDADEECDDGNLEAGDGCSPACAIEAAPPDCSFAYAAPHELRPATGELVAVTIEDVCDGAGEVGNVAIVIDSIRQDEPLEGGAGDHACPDGDGVATATAHLRAEREDGGDGRVYHVAFTATDGSGQSCSGEVTVCVPRRRHHGCVDQGPLFDSTGRCTTIFTDGLESGVLDSWSEVEDGSE
jgi:cysteine-rich repeat protein